MAYKITNNLEFENARIIYPNFEGVATDYNRAGNRNFCVVIDDAEVAQKLSEDGWNVKVRLPKEEEDELFHYMQINVKYDDDKIPPTVVVVTVDKSGTPKKKCYLNEDTIKSLDKARILGVDMTIRPYNWDVNKKTGVKGYLQDMYVTIQENRFADKYDNIPE